MRKSRFTESQIVGIMKDGEAGVPLADLRRKIRLPGMSRVSDRYSRRHLEASCFYRASSMKPVQAAHPLTSWQS